MVDMFKMQSIQAHTKVLKGMYRHRKRFLTLGLSGVVRGCQGCLHHCCPEILLRTTRCCSRVL